MKTKTIYDSLIFVNGIRTEHPCTLYSTYIHYTHSIIYYHDSVLTKKQFINMFIKYNIVLLLQLAERGGIAANHYAAHV